MRGEIHELLSHQHLLKPSGWLRSGLGHSRTCRFGTNCGGCTWDSLRLSYVVWCIRRLEHCTYQAIASMMQCAVCSRAVADNR